MTFKFHQWEKDEMDAALLTQMKAVGWKFGTIGEDWRKFMRCATIDVEPSPTSPAKPKKPAK